VLVWDSTRFRDWKMWRIAERQAIMVDLLTVDGDRRRGLASALIAYAAAEMKRAGYQRLCAWIWHSNLPSIRTFERAGWRWLALVIQVQLLGVGPVIRVSRRRGGRAT
jgi:GNAT superfamily N-acetyltransferase